MGLLESLADDIKALNTNQEGDTDNAQGKTESAGDGGSGDGDYDRGRSRERITARRNTRNTGTPSQGEGKSPQEDGGASRGSLGDTPGSGEGTSEDGDTSPKSLRAPQRGEVEEETEPKTPSDWAKHRTKLRATESRIRELERELSTKAAPAPATPTAQKPEAAAQPQKKLEDLGTEPDRTKDLASWLVWDSERKQIIIDKLSGKLDESDRSTRLKQTYDAAVVQTNDLISDYKKVNQDFEPAYTHGRAEYKRALKMLHPKATDAQIEHRIKYEEVQLAMKCDQDGTNVGEVLYDMAIERFGYNPDSTAQPGGVRQSPQIRTSLKVVANNKRRSASPMEGGGQKGTGRVDVNEAAQMSPEELLALSPEDWAHLEAQGF